MESKLTSRQLNPNPKCNLDGWAVEEDVNLDEELKFFEKESIKICSKELTQQLINEIESTKNA